MGSRSRKDIFIDIDLKDLRTSHALSEFILLLPRYKKYFKFDEEIQDDLNDRIICSKLSHFIYHQQLNGLFLLHNIDEMDFQNIMKCIADNEYNSDWIWHILQILIDKSSRTVTNEKLPWIESSWNKYHIEERENNNVNEQKSNQCDDIHECEAAKRVIMALYFHYGVSKDNGLFMPYLIESESVYTDYKHILDEHLNELKIISDIATSYIKCDINTCESLAKLNTNKLKEYVQKIMSNDGISSFQDELLDTIHCLLIHAVSLAKSEDIDVKKEEIDIVEMSETE